jgi:hypothetical protein
VVEHPAGRADDDVDAALQGSELLLDRLAAVDPQIATSWPWASFCISTTICWTSSRVGARMMAWGPLPRASSISIRGMPKAAVLPVPVFAWPMTSLPSRASGISPAWIGEGVA